MEMNLSVMIYLKVCGVLLIAKDILKGGYMEKIKEVFGFLGFGISLIFSSFFKYAFIIFPLAIMDIGLTIRVIVSTVLIFLCSLFPIYHIVSIVLFVIGLNYIHQFPIALSIVYFIMFSLIVIETLWVLISFFILCKSK